jgi:bifunctional UDP-N-acetylglucosamine pyrophosphorylase / glucosamine-1-phosphate N-acetyltransferase
MVAVLILAAGEGKRMVSDLPKILHPVGGKAMIHHIIDAAVGLYPSEIGVVISSILDPKMIQKDQVVTTVIQAYPLGTGDAVRAGLEALKSTSDAVLILYGDTPLLTSDLLRNVITHHETAPTGITVVGMRVEAPNAYGRIIADDQGRIERIVEHRDAKDTERSITLCNSGIIIASSALLKHLVAQLVPHNEAGEYYLTDIIALARKEGITSQVVELASEPLQGINDRVELAAAEGALQRRWRRQFMEAGVTLIDPGSVFFCHDTQIGRDVVIHPNVTFGSEVTIGDRVRILPGCHIENSTIGHDTSIGPFAHLRDGVILGDHVAIGNFVEVKGTTIGAQSKVKHLSYLGNATLGDYVNIGAGTITCNHNGFVKSHTHIGSNAYVGSNSCLVAPVSIGEGAMVAAGSVVTDDVEDNALAIARNHQENKEAWATRFRARFAKAIVASGNTLTATTGDKTVIISRKKAEEATDVSENLLNLPLRELAKQ